MNRAEINEMLQPIWDRFELVFDKIQKLEIRVDKKEEPKIVMEEQFNLNRFKDDIKNYAESLVDRTLRNKIKSRKQKGIL